jgi:hypothetical protein
MLSLLSGYFSETAERGQRARREAQERHSHKYDTTRKTPKERHYQGSSK